MNRRLRLVASIVAALALPLVVQAQDPAKSPESTRKAKADSVLSRLFALHNKERSKAGLPTLTIASKLEDAALVHARDMAQHETMGHEGSDGSNPAERVRNAGYHYRLTGENVAAGYRTDKQVMQAWMDSPPHKKNVLGDFTEIGLAVVYDEDGKPYWCAEFGKPIPQFEPATAATDLIKRINDERVARKLPALTVDPKLARAAQDQAANLAKKKSEGGSTARFDGIDEKLYQDLAVSTASGHPDGETMVQVLLDKPDLKKQLLGKFARIGTGYATSEDGIPYWCLILANPARR